MNCAEIQMMIAKVCSDLAYVERSQAFQEIVDLPHASGELALIAVNALDMAIALRLKFSQALDKHLDDELDGIFEEAEAA